MRTERKTRRIDIVVGATLAASSIVDGRDLVRVTLLPGSSTSISSIDIYAGVRGQAVTTFKKMASADAVAIAADTPVEFDVPAAAVFALVGNGSTETITAIGKSGCRPNVGAPAPAINILTGDSSYEEFDAVGDWNLGVGWNISGGKLSKLVSTSYSVADWDKVPDPTIIGKSYKVTLTIDAVTGSPNFSIRGGGSQNLGVLGVGTHVFTVVAGSDVSKTRFVCGNTSALTVDTMFLEEL